MPTTGSDLHRIITAIEAGAGPWSLPWRTSGRLRRPTNIATGNRYRGVNVLVLWAEAQLQHYASSSWGTYRQSAAQGCQVRKGEKASTIVFYRSIAHNRDDTAPSEETSSQTRLIARGSAVFNADQVDGFQPSPAPASADPPSSTRPQSDSSPSAAPASTMAASAPSTIAIPTRSAYLAATCLQVLRADPHAIFTAASKAAHAADYLHPIAIQETGPVQDRRLCLHMAWCTPCTIKAS